MSEDQQLYQVRHNGTYLQDPDQSRIMTLLMTRFLPHKSFVYSWDELGMANLMQDCYENRICYCPQNQTWYLWDGRWIKQPDDGLLFDNLETILYLLEIYCKEQAWLVTQEGGTNDDAEIIEKYGKYISGLKRRNPMRNIISLLATKVRKYLTDFDSNPYLLNTVTAAYDLRDGTIVPDIASCNVTMQTRTYPPHYLTTRCQRWYDFIDQIMSHDSEKAAFLQRALGYSLLGVNKEECMFIAYGAQSRNGKGTLFRALENALGPDYMKTASPAMICEKRNGDSVDYNAPQPMLASLIGARIVDMAEATQGVRLDAAAMKTITGRDTLTTRGLYEKPFSFVPQFTIWLNTNYLPVVNDDTVFLSDRVWVITFDEKFEGQNRDIDLKETFADPENLPTILGWLLDGCRDYMEHGLNPPQCVKDATQNYKDRHDRIGAFLRECTEHKFGERTAVRGAVYDAYRAWCSRSDNNYKYLGTTTFYEQLTRRGLKIIKVRGQYVVADLVFKPEAANKTEVNTVISLG